MSYNKSAKNHEINSKDEMNKNTKKFIFNPFECINFSKFDEMRKKLENFYIEITDSIKDNNKIDNENINKGFYNSLEKLLTEISLIKDEKLRIAKIDEVYKWFKKKVSSFQKIKVDFKASKSHFEKYPVLDIYKRSGENGILIDHFDNENER